MPKLGKHHAFLAVLALAALVVPAVSSACGSSEVCTDVSTSLAGQLGGEAITLTWSTDSEDSSVTHYTIYRYDCGSRVTCTTYVTTVNVVGSCGEEDYSYVDDPPGDLEDWEYSVSVYGGVIPYCTYFVDPE